MDHNTAKAIIASVRPDLIVDEKDHGSHVNVRRVAGGQLHSITLPHGTANAPLTPEQEHELFVGALEHVDRFLR
ncbi:MAG: hypothetical protein ACJ8CB_17475 [Ktedonobacteraceae bacterium]